MSEKNQINIAWIGGSFFASHEILKRIKEKYAHAEMYNFDETCSFELLYNTLSTVSCFSACKLVIITKLPDVTESEKKKLREIFENLDSNNLVVFYMLSKITYKYLYSVAEKLGKLYEFDDEISVKNAKDHILKRCNFHKIELTDEALESLIANSTSSSNNKVIFSDVIESTLHKLQLYAVEKKTYDQDDIIATSVFSESFYIWNILRACDEKNFELCLSYFHKSVTNKSDAKVAINEIINILLWRFRMLLSLKELMANGFSQKQAISETSKLRKFSFANVGMKMKAESAEVQTGVNKGSAATLWSTYLCEQATNSFYGNKPQIEIYARKDLYLIVKILEESLLMARLCQLESEAYLIADIIFATICNTIHHGDVIKIQKSLVKMRENYA